MKTKTVVTVWLLQGPLKTPQLEYGDIAYYARRRVLLTTRSSAVTKKYSLEEPPRDETALLQAIGKKRSALVSGGRIDLNKTSAIFIHDYRSGTLGNSTLETPTSIEIEITKTEKIITEKLAKKQARKANWLAGTKSYFYTN